MDLVKQNIFKMDWVSNESEEINNDQNSESSSSSHQEHQSGDKENNNFGKRIGVNSQNDSISDGDLTDYSLNDSEDDDDEFKNNNQSKDGRFEHKFFQLN